jgi:hypothetical protein
LHGDGGLGVAQEGHDARDAIGVAHVLELQVPRDRRQRFAAADASAQPREL